MNQLLFERYLKNFRETLRENGIENISEIVGSVQPW